MWRLLFFFYYPHQTQQLQMQPMSRPDVNPEATETQQMRGACWREY